MNYDDWKTTPPKEPRRVRVKVELTFEFDVDESDGEETHIETQAENHAKYLEFPTSRDCEIDEVEVKEWNVVKE